MHVLGLDLGHMGALVEVVGPHQTMHGVYVIYIDIDEAVVC
jgi:hypothetical protein